MELTQEGQMLKVQAEKCLFNVNEFFHQAKRLQNDLVGTAKISLHTSPEMLKIGEFFSIINAKYPHVECHLLQKRSSEVPELLRKRKIDVGYFYGNVSEAEIAVRLLRTCKLMIVGPVSWRERFEYAGLEELGQLPWVGTSQCCPFHTATYEIFQQRRLNISTTIALVDQETTLLNLVSAGAGLALLVDEDALSAEKAGKVVVWKPESFTMNLCVAYLEEREKDPIIQVVLDGMHMVWGIADREFAVHPPLQ